MPFCWHCVGRQHTQTSGKLTMVSTETLPFLPWPDTRVKTEMGVAGFVGKLGQLYLGPRRHLKGQYGGRSSEGREQPVLHSQAPVKTDL